ncbi:heavy-metal-associated domain-containing protein [Desulfitobacterium hafniense]|uniref:heavy-metal-associated domain-containing protein n=1 Tax=Desulfitobacterium hafniense TaxID=49338 RepID=UPI0002DF0AA0|nr:heavy metal-associated domain-containing protein [Desulfitobacterium hafniense]
MFRWFGKKKDRDEFQIEGEFCEHCAAKMERELSKIIEIGQTKINYELKTISLPATMKDQAQAIMERIEPGGVLVRVDEEAS